MTLFQIFRGKRIDLDKIKCTEGYAYFADDDNLYIDVGNGPVETDRKLVGGSPTSGAYKITIQSAQWVKSPSGDQYTYDWKNTDLKCGKNGDVPPIISCDAGLNAYGLIVSAEATPGSGIVFTAKSQPKESISLTILTDLK